MIEVRIDLKSPSVLRVLSDVPTMQRWEILRGAQRPFTMAELAESAGVSRRTRSVRSTTWSRRGLW